MDGVNSDLLLKNADELATICHLDLMPMVVALQKLHLVVTGCFSHVVAGDVKRRFSDFTESLRSLQVFEDFTGKSKVLKLSKIILNLN